jgi:hypothetical protein
MFGLFSFSRVLVSASDIPRHLIHASGIQTKHYANNQLAEQLDKPGCQALITERLYLRAVLQRNRRPIGKVSSPDTSRLSPGTPDYFKSWYLNLPVDVAADT